MRCRTRSRILTIRREKPLGMDMRGSNRSIRTQFSNFFNAYAKRFASTKPAGGYPFQQTGTIVPEAERQGRCRSLRSLTPWHVVFVSGTSHSHSFSGSPTGMPARGTMPVSRPGESFHNCRPGPSKLKTESPPPALKILPARRSILLSRKPLIHRNW